MSGCYQRGNHQKKGGILNQQITRDHLRSDFRQRRTEPCGLSHLGVGPGQEEEEAAKEMGKQQQGRRRRKPGECGAREPREASTTSCIEYCCGVMETETELPTGTAL